MPRILAIDWDRHEVRGLLVASGATGTSVTGAWVASLVTSDPEGLSGKQIGARLAAAMSGQVSGKPVTLVGVGRDNVQMQLLSLPPAPPEELPDLVRFQSEREFTTLGADAALDYIPISGDAETPNRVLAIALTPAGLVEAREVCEALDVELDRVPLRACAAAALVHRAGIVDAERMVLVVNPLTDEADFTVQAGERVVLMRTVRLPDPNQSESRQRALLGEIRRTMAAVRQQLADRKVEQVVICGNRETVDRSETLTDELDVPVTLFDPVVHAPSGIASHGVPSASLSRFAAVLGMALGEADRRPPIVDFANVRKRAVARRFSRVHALAAGAAAVVALGLIAFLWQQIAEPTRELADLKAQIATLQTNADKYKEVIDKAAAVDRWLATDINWLDELEQFARKVRPQPMSSKEFPVNDDIVVTQVIMGRPGGIGAVGGLVDLQAVAKSDAAVRDLEQRLRDETHRVMPGGIQKDTTVPGYPRSLDLKVTVAQPADRGAEAKP